MLTISIPEEEFYDEEKEEFVKYSSCELTLEHSLVSISKWESKWKKPFLGKEEKTIEQSIDYIRCMTLSKNVDPIVYKRLPSIVFDQIREYIADPMTATWFSKDTKRPKNREVITSELIYYWMIAYQIPFECQKWHLNRLLTLIQICAIKNQPAKKMSHKDLMSRQRSLNAARRMASGSKG